MKPLDRRRFFQITLAGAAAVAAPRRAWALGAADKLHIVRLRYDGDWDVAPGALTALALEIRYRTSINVAPTTLALRAGDPRMASLPLAVLAGDGDFALRAADRQALGRWLDLGGFLLIDNNGKNGISTTFDEAVRRELRALFPREPLRRVSPAHVIYRSFYRLDYPAGLAIRKPYVEGIRMGRRYGVIYSSNDLLGAWARDASGHYRHEPTPGGEHQREMAFRFGINLVMYGMCLHYKDDQVHLDYLLHRRKWKITPPK